MRNTRDGGVNADDLERSRFIERIGWMGGAGCLSGFKINQAKHWRIEGYVILLRRGRALRAGADVPGDCGRNIDGSVALCDF